MAEKAKDGITHTIYEAKKLLRHFYKTQTPTLLWGAPGIGKSDSFKQLAAEMNVGLIDIRAGTKLPEDFTGIPVPDLEKRVAVWLKANFWPDVKRNGPKGILVFDEITDTSKPVQSVLYRVILDRMISEDEKLPEGWWPVGAGNRRSDRAAAQAFSTALANRFAHIHVEPDPEAFVRWALSQDFMGHLVPGFIKFRPNLLHSMEGADLFAFPSPRTWAQVARNIEDCEPEMMLKVVAALVGDGAAGEFAAYMRTIDLPDLDDIVANPSKCKIPKEPSSKYALSCMLARYMARDNIDKIMIYVRRTDFGKDFEIATVWDATKRDTSLTETKAFTDFANRNADMQL